MRAFNRFYTERLGVLGRGYLDSGYTLTEARVIYEIGAAKSLTARTLSRDLHLDPAYLSRIIKRLKTEGVIETQTDPQDRRSQIVTITPIGHTLFEQLGDRSRRQIADMLQPLSPDDRSRLCQSFSAIRHLLHPDGGRRQPPVIRAHRPGDMGWIVQSQARFYTAAFGWNDQFEALVAEVVAKFLKGHDPALEHCWIAERSGVNIGSIMIMNGGEGVAKLRLLYVDEAARGLGLGRLLVEECIRFARRAGYHRLSLWTNDILHPAIAIYRKTGFRLEAEERHTLFGPELIGQTWVLDL
ncbi:MarR family transcriptional regulator [Rhizobium sp. CG5]|uniref:bifunctional helix-turn-helix transcriptional regulator/GNAT family N-acetyltransferase n=1 Tax=Rhizobium sp. CG5 TaxID=2726076 RepID=UPI002033C1DB|nr:helix-turn-helix domain-containing GNAT family N-acetyltransferase [Rhizobium sp. CG5]MCM2472074.1 MarR family transcriptional regulator [Rhizobium sp. CG5]